MFNKHKIKMDKLKMLRTTSKKALMDSALIVCNGDYQKAGELFDLYNNRMNLPDVDILPPSTFSQIKDTAGELFSWIDANGEKIITWVDVIKNLKSGGKVAKIPSSPLPKI